MNKPNPGSDEAVAQGCICPRMDNEYGDIGKTGGYFTTAQGCPLHWPTEANQPIPDRERIEVAVNLIANHTNEFLNPWLFKTALSHDELTHAFQSIKTKLIPAIEAIVREARIDELNKAETIFKCEFGHDVIGHKTADGYCCACDADIAFLRHTDTNKQMFHSIERFHTTTGGLDTPTNENKETDR